MKCLANQTSKPNHWLTKRFVSGSSSFGEKIYWVSSRSLCATRLQKRKLDWASITWHFAVRMAGVLDDVLWLAALGHKASPTPSFLSTTARPQLNAQDHKAVKYANIGLLDSHSPTDKCRHLQVSLVLHICGWHDKAKTQSQTGCTVPRLCCLRFWGANSMQWIFSILDSIWFNSILKLRYILKEFLKRPLACGIVAYYVSARVCCGGCRDWRHSALTVLISTDVLLQSGYSPGSSGIKWIK